MALQSPTYWCERRFLPVARHVCGLLDPSSGPSGQVGHPITYTLQPSRTHLVFEGKSTTTLAPAGRHGAERSAKHLLGWQAK